MILRLCFLDMTLDQKTEHCLFRYVNAKLLSPSTDALEDCARFGILFRKNKLLIKNISNRYFYFIIFQAEEQVLHGYVLIVVARNYEQRTV